MTSFSFSIPIIIIPLLLLERPKTVSQAAVTIEISILVHCFCSFDLFCPLLDKDISMENLYIAL